MVQDISVDGLRQIDAECDRFEQEWRGGKRPSLEEYLLRHEAVLRPRLLESLQKVQQELLLGQFAGVSSAAAADVPAPGPIPSAPAARALPPTPAVAAGSEETLDWNVPKVTFQVVAGPHEGLEFVYSKHDTLLVGRSSQAQLRLKDDPHFSRNHFRLEVNPPTCYLMDLKSRSGTFVNGERVAERFLQDGDLVSGGRTKIKVSVRSPSAGPNQPSRGSPQPNSAAGPSPAPRRSPSPQIGPAGEDAEIPQIGGYDFHEQIGAGDLGKTYWATRLATGEACALKVIVPAARADEKAVQTFLREASIHNQLQHANIVRFIEMGASGANLFLSTEFLTVLAWRELSARWSASQRIRIASGLMAQILGALEFAHARSLVHRDVKPGNVLIHRSNGKLAAKLADFGLAKQYTMAGMSQMTREGDVIGSLPYMSPEQFINSREARPACDLYSAGATLYWMLSGHEPIVLENHPCKFLAILEDPPVPLHERLPEVPTGLSQIVHRALEKDPLRRFASAAEMRQQLRVFAK